VIVAAIDGMEPDQRPDDRADSAGSAPSGGSLSLLAIRYIVEFSTLLASENLKPQLGHDPQNTTCAGEFRPVEMVPMGLWAIKPLIPPIAG